uniref:keratin, type I cytoskeletal 9-like n=1 Tax=Erigeron canadensis TaxID=72917 RepID=UPI001CB907B9|nr:keratin, type I cytoskeletal 9-like [Erigeron canadensis]
MATTRTSAGTSGGRGRGRGENEDSGQGRGIGRGTGRSGGHGIGRGTGPEVVQGVGRGAGRGNEQAGDRGTGRGVGRGAGHGRGRGSGRGRGRGKAENETTNEQAGMQPDLAMIAMITQVFCTATELVKLEREFLEHKMVGADHAGYTTHFNELSRLVLDLVEPENKGIEKYLRGLIPQVRSTMAVVHPLTLEEAILRSEAITEELVQCGTITAVQVAVHPNQLQITGPNQNRGNQAPAARGRAFVLNAAEARNDPNVVAADYSFVATSFVPLLSAKPSPMYLCFDVEMANGGAKIVRIPLPNGEILEVQGEVSDSFEGRVMSASAKEVSLIDVLVVRDYQDVFPDDLPGLPPSRQLDFRISLVPNAAPVAKSPYRLTTTELQELATQLKEL